MLSVDKALQTAMVDKPPMAVDMPFPKVRCCADRLSRPVDNV